LQEIIKQLEAKGGLEYCNRAQNVQGRIFEHASDARLLIKALAKTDLKEVASQELTLLFTIVLTKGEGESLPKDSSDF
jgi:hypothetical protein